MPQHEDLRVFGCVTARQEDQPDEQPNHEEIDEADEHERGAYTSKPGRHARF